MRLFANLLSRPLSAARCRLGQEDSRGAVAGGAVEALLAPCGERCRRGSAACFCYLSVQTWRMGMSEGRANWTFSIRKSSLPHSAPGGLGCPCSRAIHSTAGGRTCLLVWVSLGLGGRGAGGGKEGYVPLGANQAQVDAATTISPITATFTPDAEDRDSYCSLLTYYVPDSVNRFPCITWF